MADLTIIMPTWNKADTIAEALDSVFRQKTSRISCFPASVLTIFSRKFSMFFALYPFSDAFAI